MDTRRDLHAQTRRAQRRATVAMWLTIGAFVGLGLILVAVML